MVPVGPDPSSTVLARLRALPAGARLLEALDGPLPRSGGKPRHAPRVEGPLSGVFLVGGAVRDLLAGRTPHELDLVVEGDAHALAEELRRRLVGKGRVHEAFGTATVEAPDGVRVDVAQARTETYPRPGALPDVSPAASVQVDLARRDFTLNAIAIGISGDVAGELHAVPHALEDLEAGRLRVLHDRSFLDDPTRLLRMIRYAARLGYAIEPHTEALSRAAIAAGALETAGVARVGRELQLLLDEPDPVAGLVLLRDLGAARELDVDEPLLRRALALAPPDAEPANVLLALLTRHFDRAHRRGWFAGIHLRGARSVDAAAHDPAGLAAALRGAETRSALSDAVRGLPVEAVVVAAALHAEAEEAARRWIDDVRHVRLRINGADLLGAGVPQGPEIGDRLAHALRAKLDDGLETRDEELAAALAAV